MKSRKTPTIKGCVVEEGLNKGRRNNNQSLQNNQSAENPCAQGIPHRIF